MADVLEDYVLSSLVEVFYFSDSWKADDAHHRSLYNTSTRAFLSPQGWAYDNCFRMFSYRHTFMVLIDPDEYIILKQQPLQQQTAAANATAGAAAIAAAPDFGPAPDPPSLPAFLAAFEPYGGILVHWQLFGPSGHMRRPRGSTLEQYTQCQPKPALQNWRQFNSIPLGFVKSITATRCYQRGCNPHVCELKPGCRYVNEKFLELSSSVVKAVHWDRIAVFHYVTRSAEDYKAKMGRGTGHSQFLAANKAAGRTHRGWRYFLTVNASATATCLEGRDAWQRCCSARNGGGGAAAAGAGVGVVAGASVGAGAALAGAGGGAAGVLGGAAVASGAGVGDGGGSVGAANAVVGKVSGMAGGASGTVGVGIGGGVSGGAGAGAIARAESESVGTGSRGAEAGGAAGAGGASTGAAAQGAAAVDDGLQVGTRTILE